MLARFEKSIEKWGWVVRNLRKIKVQQGLVFPEHSFYFALISQSHQIVKLSSHG